MGLREVAARFQRLQVPSDCIQGPPHFQLFSTGTHRSPLTQERGVSRWATPDQTGQDQEHPSRIAPITLRWGGNFYGADSLMVALSPKPRLDQGWRGDDSDPPLQRSTAASKNRPYLSDRNTVAGRSASLGGNAMGCPCSPWMACRRVGPSISSSTSLRTSMR